MYVRVCVGVCLSLLLVGVVRSSDYSFRTSCSDVRIMPPL
jgi:hypothetical protein